MDNSAAILLLLGKQLTCNKCSLVIKTLMHFGRSANMAAQAQAGYSSYSNEIKEKLSLWDVKDSPLAPLSEKQRNSVLELTTVAGNRPLLDEVSSKMVHLDQLF